MHIKDDLAKFLHATLSCTIERSTSLTFTKGQVVLLDSTRSILIQRRVSAVSSIGYDHLALLKKQSCLNNFFYKMHMSMKDF